MQLILLLAVFLVVLVFLSFIVIYFIQNGMVYVPYSPSKAFRYPEANA